MPRILMYTQPGCPFCKRAQELLRSKGAAWDEVDLEEHPERRSEMMERGGGHTVPQIWIGDVYVGGCDDLFSLESDGRLDPLLEGPGAV